METKVHWMMSILIGWIVSNAAPVAAQLVTKAVSPDPSPAWTAASVIAKHAAVVGDFDQLHSRRVKLRLVGMAPFDLPTVVEAKRPHFLRREVNIQGQLQITAYDGKEAWKIDPFLPSGKKAVEVAAVDLPALMEEALFDGIVVKAAALGFSPRYLGERGVQGRAAHVIALTVPGTGETTVFLDTITFLEIKRLQRRLVMGRMTDLEVLSSDYRQQDDVWMPFKIEIGAVGASAKIVMLMELVENNPSIPDARFKRPN
jgi:hypothetical protein